MITADALHLQVDHARYLHDRDAFYLIYAKGNQPTVRQALTDLPWSDIPPAHVEKDRTVHGRDETRTTEIVEVRGAGLPFPHARQVLRIRRWRRERVTGKTSIECIYAVTNLSIPQGHGR